MFASDSLPLFFTRRKSRSGDIKRRRSCELSLFSNISSIYQNEFVLGACRSVQNLGRTRTWLLLPSTSKTPAVLHMSEVPKDHQRNRSCTFQVVLLTLTPKARFRSQNLESRVWWLGLLERIYFIKTCPLVSHGSETIQQRLKRCHERDRRKKGIKRESEDNHVGKTGFLKHQKRSPATTHEKAVLALSKSEQELNRLSAQSKDVYKYRSWVCLSLLYHTSDSGVQKCHINMA